MTDKKKSKAPGDSVGAKLVIYSGKVQGVGFRATTLKISQGFPVTGYVRNLEDGRVEILAEGPTNEVEGFLTRIKSFFKDHIQDEESSQVPSQGRARFEILND